MIKKIFRLSHNFGEYLINKAFEILFMFLILWNIFLTFIFLSLFFNLNVLSKY